VQQAAYRLPTRPGGQGPTHGEVFSHNGQALRSNPIRSHDDRSLIADLDLDERQRAARSMLSHVEAHVAAAMRRGDLPANTVLVTNNRVCRGQLSCSRLLRGILKQGHQLTVYETDTDGTPLPRPRIFPGTGERIKA
jgi:hypothetical protein